MKVVPLNAPHKISRGDGMNVLEKKVGNINGVIKACDASEEEQERAIYEFHMAVYAIFDEMIERGEAS